MAVSITENEATDVLPLTGRLGLGLDCEAKLTVDRFLYGRSATRYNVMKTGLSAVYKRYRVKICSG